MKLLIINGPNINLLGVREKHIYGNESYEDLLRFIDEACQKAGVEHECFQSNHEGDIVDKIQQALGVFDGIVINPAAYTHTSVAILDALKAVACTCRTSPSGRSSGKFPMPAWPARPPLPVWASRAMKRPFSI